MRTDSAWPVVPVLTVSYCAVLAPPPSTPPPSGPSGPAAGGKPAGPKQRKTGRYGLRFLAVVYVGVLTDRYRRGLHDRAAGTIVIDNDYRRPRRSAIVERLPRG